jgi:hypothetical protein
MARSLNRYALLRSWNPENGSHGVADQFAMSGRKMNPSLHYPTYGSVVSWHKGFKSALPAFVQLGSSLDRRFGGGSAGILGLEHNPFEILADPNGKGFNVRDISDIQSSRPSQTYAGVVGHFAKTGRRSGRSL